MTKVQPFLVSDPSSNQEQVEKLQKLIDMAHESQRRLKETDHNLKEFMVQRDKLNELVDSLNDQLSGIEQKGQRNVLDAQKDLEHLKVR